MLFLIFEHSIFSRAGTMALASVNASFHELFSLLLIPVDFSGEVSCLFIYFVVPDLKSFVVLNSLLEFRKNLIFVLESFLLLFSKRKEGGLSGFGLSTLQLFNGAPPCLNLIAKLAINLFSFLKLTF